MKQVHLIANAHLDPVWLWRWQEGCSEALSTFRTAEELTGEFPSFVFNHNESILYEWVKENSPQLFEKIKKAVREKRWHIMGGWYLQPDCNMPSGESMIRNIEKGKRFFAGQFGETPTTAVNFDSFGHSRGLVQILKKSGYDSYIICRPGKKAFPFRNQDFEWEGLDGSKILVHRSDENYNTVWGQAANEMMDFLPQKEEEKVTLYLWGVGDHGGGPTRKDLTDIKTLMSTNQHYHMIHSTPEAYFKELRKEQKDFPKVAVGLNPVSQGCYTSQVRVKQKHRLLENEIYSAEKMSAAAQLQCGRDYPAKDIEDALSALLFSEFHDALAGSGSHPVEEDTLRLLDYGLVITGRIKHSAALALAQGEKKAGEGTSVVFFFNPHPYDITGVFSCETGLPKQNWTTDFMYPKVKFNGELIPTQAEKESSNFNIDWRKKIAVQATLKAGSMNRMDVYYEPVPKRPVPPEIISLPAYTFDNGTMRVVIDMATGWLREYSVNGETYLTKDSMQLVCFDDTYNAWGLGRNSSHVRRTFQLLTEHEASDFCGLGGKVIPPVRLIEDGDVRTTVEAIFGIHSSKAFVRYQLPKKGNGFDMEIGVGYQEKEQYLKLICRTPHVCDSFQGQIMFGREEFIGPGEKIAQKWVMVQDKKTDRALAVINDGTYGVSYENQELGLTLLRSAGYSAADFTMGKTLTEEQWIPRMEQGERFYHFRILGDRIKEIENNVDREAQAFNEQPYGFSYCPPGEGKPDGPFISVDNPRVIVSAFKKAVNFDGFILRLYESTGKAAEAEVSILDGKIRGNIKLNPFEIKTYKIEAGSGMMMETDMIEDVCRSDEKREI